MNNFYNIILVEDNIDDVNLIKRVINKSQLPVNLNILEDGEKAVEYFMNYKDNNLILPKMMMLDLNLPKVSGLDVLKILRKELQINCLPIVIFTSSKEIKDIEESYNYCANSFVVKPIEYDKFYETVVALIKYWILYNENHKN